MTPWQEVWWSHKCTLCTFKIFGLISPVDVTLYVMRSDRSVTPSEITNRAPLRGIKHPKYMYAYAHKTYSDHQQQIQQSDRHQERSRCLNTGWERGTSSQPNSVQGPKNETTDQSWREKCVGEVVRPRRLVPCWFRMERNIVTLPIRLLPSPLPLTEACCWHRMQQL